MGCLCFATATLGPLLRLEMLRVAKPRWGGGKEKWDKSGSGEGGRRVGGCAGSALGFVFQILLGEGGVYALGTSCTEAFLEGGMGRKGSQQLFKGFDKLGEQLITWQAVNSCPGAICSSPV